MRFIVFLSILFLSFPVAVDSQQPASRFGALELREGEDGRKHRLLFNGEELLASEAETIDIVNVLNGRGRDYVVAVTYSGGIACPAQVTIVEIFKRGRYRLSGDFGSCSDVIKARLVQDKVIVEMPQYVPHPELWSKNELRRAQRTTWVYTWYKGKLSKRTALR
jgi:hypothetical protein